MRKPTNKPVGKESVTRIAGAARSQDLESKVDSVVNWYRERFALATRGRLPSVRTAARLCGVSTRTVQSAVAILVTNGSVVARGGSGLFVAGVHKPEPPVRQNDRMGFDEVACDIAEALGDGRLQSEPRLPPLKEMFRLWPVSEPTLRKALRSLVLQGLLEKRGASYGLAGDGLQKHSPSLREILLVAAATQGRVRMDTHREVEFFRGAEEECTARGLKLRVIGYDEAHKQFLPAQPAIGKSVAGVLFSPWHLLQETECLRKILGWNVPVSMWLEAPDKSHLVKRWASRKEFALFSIGYGREPGLEVGRYLQERGICYTAYISPFHGSEWSRDRLAGLRTIFSEVPAFTRDEFLNPWTFRDQVDASVLGRLDAQLLLPAELKHRQVPGSKRALMEWREKTCEFARDLDILQVLEPLLRQALQTPKLQALVFANDLCAVLAQDLLAQMIPSGNRWPEMVSFDNSPAAFLHGIDSYEFNTRGMVQAMIHHLLAPRNPIYSPGKVLHPRGHVVRRAL